MREKLAGIWKVIKEKSKAGADYVITTAKALYERLMQWLEGFRIKAEIEEAYRPEDVNMEDIKTPYTDREEITPDGVVTSPIVYWRIIVNLVLSLIGVVLLAVLLPKVISFFMPFVVASIIALIATPLVKLLRKKLKITQKLSSALVIFIVIIAVAGILWGVIVLVMKGITAISENGQQIFENFEKTLNGVTSNFSDVYAILPDEWQDDFTNLRISILNTVRKLLEIEPKQVTDFLSNSVDFLFSAIVSIIAAYFFTSQRQEILTAIKKLTPKSTIEYFRLIGTNFKKAIGGYFEAQFKIMLIMFVIMFIWLQVMDVPLSALVALGVAFLDFLPVFGMGAVYWPWIIIDLLLGKYKEAISIGILYGVCQLIRQLLQPKLVSESVEMSPLATLFFMFMGYKISGFLGLIIGIPIGMVIISLYKIGAFDRITRGIKILVKAVNDFRKY